MKLVAALTVALGGATAVTGLSLPTSLSRRSTDVSTFFAERSNAFHQLFEKRRGGGGRSSGGYSSSGGRSGSSSSSKPPPNTLGSSNRGGRTSDGSGAPRSFGKGKFYGGGARVPYKAGKKSPSGLKPVFIPLATLKVIFPGPWLYGAWSYKYQLTYLNETVTDQQNPNGTIQTRTANCLCQNYQVCGCNTVDDDAYEQSLLGSAAFAALNDSLVVVTKYQGQTQILINGTLPNGTTAEGAAGGNRKSALEHASWTVVAAVLMYSFWLM